MIKLALAAGVTLSILCGFMTLRSSFPNLLGGSRGSGSGGLNSITNTLSGSGSSGLSSFSLFTNSDSSSSGSGSGYLPPQASSKYLPPKNESSENSTSGFRIFITPTPKTTTATPNNISTTDSLSALLPLLKTDNSTSAENEVENLLSSVAPVKTVTSTVSLATSSSSITSSTSQPSSSPVPILVMMADAGKSAALGEGGVSKPSPTHEPPTTVSLNSVTTNVISVETENKIGMNLTENISKPENTLKPPNPNTLYLPPPQ